MSRKLVIGMLCLAVLVPGALAQDRTCSSVKGSLLVYPKVEVRWDAAGNLVQDTFITVNNDYPADVLIQAYFLSEPCNWFDNFFELTMNQPAYWAASSGLPLGVSPWDILGDPYPDPEGSGEFIIRGSILLWAVDADHREIRWNHLYGGAIIVNYNYNTAWEYNAYAFPAVTTVPHGGLLYTPYGRLDLDGTEYVYGYAKLLMDFFAVGATAFSGGGDLITHDTDLTLFILSNDLRQDGAGPFRTKAYFELWNENELGISGTEYCVQKYNETLFSTVGGPLMVENLHTNMGRARITGVQSYWCDLPQRPSTDQSLLGVQARILSFDGGAPETDIAGSNLFGSGTQAATIWYDIPEVPPELRNRTQVPGNGVAR